ncbi:hypothetical protein TIFTF001_018152 [Ficus carica]|uniref:Uncharacterized protein n=1 Tax=Ficus carica TaxID=3494 RepID=A0AA88A3P6_FICCA|nr:hypothetical protein TIFTF001_018152 [Ficus carica]
MRGSTAVLNFPVERVQQSLQDMKLLNDWEFERSPAETLKQRHYMRRKRSKKSIDRRSKGKDQTLSDSSNSSSSSCSISDVKVVLEDLGAEYLDQLLLASCSTTEPSPTHD